MSKVYLSRYENKPPRIPAEPSQLLPMPTIAAARIMFAGCPVTIDKPRMVVFDVGNGLRVALTDYALK